MHLLFTLPFAATSLFVCANPLVAKEPRPDRIIPSERLCDGTQPCLSPDGQTLALVRWTTHPITVGTQGEPLRTSHLCIRNLMTGMEEERPLSECPIGWVGENILLLKGGMAIDLTSGEQFNELAQIPNNLEIVNTWWSQDGRQLCYLPNTSYYRNNPQVAAPPGVTGSIYLKQRHGPARELALGSLVNPDAPGTLSFSPDGTRIAFHLLFYRNGDVPQRRIGLVDIASGKAQIVHDGVYVHGNWGMQRAERLNCQRRNRWDQDGRFFTFVTGRGSGDADVYLAANQGQSPLRITGDGSPKWSPSLDPEGRRVAFFQAERRDDRGNLSGVHIRVLDLLIGEAPVVDTPETGRGHTLLWSDDGKHLFFDWEDGEEMDIHRCSPPEPPAMPVDTPIKTIPFKIEQEIVAALGSQERDIVSWGIEKAYEYSTPAIIAEVRAALENWLKSQHYRCAVDMIRFLQAVKDNDAGEVVLPGLEPGSHEQVKRAAIHALMEWKVAEALPALERLRKNSGDASTRACAAGACVSLRGNQEDWTILKNHAQSPDADARSTVTTVLRQVRDARSVDYLIELTEDSKRLYWDYTGEVHVGDRAEESLAILTGMTFDRNQAKWLEWWEARSRKLPRILHPNPALVELKRLAKIKAERRQLELRGK